MRVGRNGATRGSSTTSTTDARPPELLEEWLASASRSKLKPFVKLARTIGKRRDGILAAIGLGLSNGRLSGLNSRVCLSATPASPFTA